MSLFLYIIRYQEISATPKRQSFVGGRRRQNAHGCGGKSGSKIHLWVDQFGMALTGANVHDNWLGRLLTIKCRALPTPKTKATDEKSHLCLDKAYDMKRFESKALSHSYTQHIPRTCEEKQKDVRRTQPA